MFYKLKEIYRYIRVKRLIKKLFVRCQKYDNYSAMIYYQGGKIGKYHRLLDIIKSIFNDSNHGIVNYEDFKCNENCDVRVRKAIKEISCTFKNGSRILIKTALECNARGYRFHYCLIDKDIPQIKQDYIETHVIRKFNDENKQIKKRDFGVAKYIRII